MSIYISKRAKDEPKPCQLWHPPQMHMLSVGLDVHQVKGAQRGLQGPGPSEAGVPFASPARWEAPVGDTPSSGAAECCARPDGGLLASVDVSHAFAPSAAHVAAPNKLALAPLHVPDHVGVVASATAEEVAAVRALWRAVAFSALRARDPQFLVLYAVIGRLINVEQILLANRYFPLIFVSPAHFPLYFVWDLDTVFIFILQQMANLFERGHGFPARFHSAGAGNSVTAAIYRHQLGDGLKPTGMVLNIIHDGFYPTTEARLTSPLHFLGLFSPA